MRVLHVIRDLDDQSGGPSRSIPALSLALEKVGFVSGILFEDRGRRLSPMVGADRRDYIPIARKSRRWQAQVQDELARQPSFDVIHSHGLWAGINHAAISFASRRRIPFIVSPRGMLEPWALSHKRWRKRLAMMLYQSRDLRAAGCIHVTGELEARRCRELGYLNPIAMVSNGIELPPEIDATLTHGTRRLLFMGRLHEIKGLDRLVKSWSRASTGNWECVIAGHNEGGYADEVRRLIDEEGVGNSIKMHGPVSGQAKWDLMRTASAFVLPSHSENFGIVIAEALACSVPVIASTGTPWEALNINDCGWWVDNSIDSLADTISLVCSKSQEELSEMGHRGRKLVEKKCCWKSIAQEMADVYRWLRKGKAGTVPDSIINCEDGTTMPKRRTS